MLMVHSLITFIALAPSSSIMSPLAVHRSRDLILLPTYTTLQEIAQMYIPEDLEDPEHFVVFERLTAVY